MENRKRVYSAQESLEPYSYAVDVNDYQSTGQPTKFPEPCKAIRANKAIVVKLYFAANAGVGINHSLVHGEMINAQIVQVTDDAGGLLAAESVYAYF